MKSSYQIDVRKSAIHKKNDIIEIEMKMSFLKSKKKEKKRRVKKPRKEETKAILKFK